LLSPLDLQLNLSRILGVRHEDYEIKKPRMQNTEDKDQMEDLVVNTIFIFNQ
jgi:hypothetical protein